MKLLKLAIRKSSWLLSGCLHLIFLGTMLVFGANTIIPKPKLYSTRIDIKTSSEMNSNIGFRQPLLSHEKIKIEEEEIIPDALEFADFVIEPPTKEIQLDNVSGAVFIQAKPIEDSINNKLPLYPEQAREFGQEGLVVLCVEVLADGASGKIIIKHSSGYPILDNSAVKAVAKWNFIPAMNHGKAIKSTIEIPIRFKLT